MAVQIGKVQRIEPTTPQSVGRLEVQPPNIAEIGVRNIDVTSKNVDAISDTLIKLETEAQKKARQLIDTRTTDLANQYKMKLSEERNKLKTTEGYFAPMFDDYDKKEDEYYNEIMGIDKNEDPYFIQSLTRKMQNAKGESRSDRNKLQFEKAYAYNNQVADSSVKLSQDEAFNKAMELNMANPATFTAFNVYVERIKAFRQAQADKNGTLLYNDDGTPALKDSPAWVQVREDVGGVIIPTVKSLNAAGKVAEARALINKYDDMLNAADKAKLISDSDEADIKNQALEKLSTLGPNPTIAQINSVDASEAVKLKMREINHTNKIHLERENEEKSKITLSDAYRKILAKQASNRPYANATEFINSPEGKDLADKLSPSDFGLLKKATESVVNSDQNTLGKIFNHVQNDTLKSLGPKEYIELSNKLNTDDKAWFRRLYEQGTAATSEPRKMSIVKDALTNFDKIVGDFKNEYGDEAFPKRTKGSRKGQYVDPDDVIRLNKAKQNIEVLLNNPKASYNPKEREKIIRDELQSALDDKQNSRSEIQKYMQDKGAEIRQKAKGYFNDALNSIFGGNSTSVKTVPKSEGLASSEKAAKSTESSTKGIIDKNTGSDMSKWKMGDFMSSFVKEFGREPKDIEELKNYKKAKLEGK